MTAVRTYGSDLALVVVDGRCARITVEDAAPEVLDVGEEIGPRAVANRAIAGLPASVGLVAVSRDRGPSGVAALVTTAAATPRAGAVLPGRAPLSLDRATVLLRRAAWDSVDGWDTRLPDPARADADLAARLERAGWLVVAVPAAAPTG